MKINFLFVFLASTFYCLKLFSQPPIKQWDFRFGGSDWEELKAVQQTDDGGYVLGGYSYSGISGDKTQASQGSSDYWMLKTDNNGIKQWDARFGGSSGELFECLDQTDDGGYILGGWSHSGISGDKTQASQGLSDYWIVKTDANGQKQWDARFGGSDPDYLMCLQQTADGGYILGGYSGSGISGDKTQSSQGTWDYWIVKTDANGQKQWDARFGGSGQDQLYSLQQTLDGGYVLGGYSSSGISGDKTQASQGSTDYWIVKTDANGLKQWDARFGGSLEEILFSLQQSDDSGYILGGYSSSGISGDKTQSSQGNKDYWIVKIDANGLKQWDARYGGSDYDELFSLEQTADGGYILGGYSRSGVSGNKTQLSKGGSDFWIVKVDGNGIIQWDAGFGGSGDEVEHALQQTIDGGFILGGYSFSGISGDKTQPSQGGMDYWVLKTDMGVLPCITPQNISTDSITSNQATIKWDAVYGAIKYKVKYKIANTSEWVKITTTNNHKILSGLLPSTKYVWQVKTICNNQPTNTSEWSNKLHFITGPLRLSSEESNFYDDQDLIVAVYPNPAKNELTIKLSEQCSDVTIFIYDVHGKFISVPKIVEYPQVQINITDLPKGFYTMQIIDNNLGRSRSINFVKQE